MILTELKQYIVSKVCVSRKELAREFGLSEDGVDAMMSVWIKKGSISRLVDTDQRDRVKRVRYTLVADNAIALTVSM